MSKKLERDELLRRQIELTKDWIMFARHTVDMGTFNSRELRESNPHLSRDRVLVSIAVIELIAEKKIIPIADEDDSPKKGRYIYARHELP